MLAAVAVALFGVVPRWAMAAWGVLGGCLLLSQIGPVLRLSQRVLDLSPFGHVSKLPGGQLGAAPVLWLAALAAALTIAGLAGFRRRDVG